MKTAGAFSLQTAVTAEAAWQTMVQAMRAALLASGLTRMTDVEVTGQIDPVTTVHGSTNGMVGFEIYKIPDDAITPTLPMHLRVEYMYATSSGNGYFRFRLGLGGVSSTGAFLGPTSDYSQSYSGGSTPSTPMYGHTAPGRLWFTFGNPFGVSVPSGGFRLIVDRLRDANGQPTDKGAWFSCASLSSSGTTGPAQVVPSSGVPPAAFTNTSSWSEGTILLPAAMISTASAIGQYSSALSNTAVSPLLAMRGDWYYLMGAGGRASDFLLGSSYNIPLLGGNQLVVPQFSGGSSPYYMMLPYE